MRCRSEFLEDGPSHTPNEMGSILNDTQDMDGLRSDRSSDASRVSSPSVPDQDYAPSVNEDVREDLNGELNELSHK